MSANAVSFLFFCIFFCWSSGVLAANRVVVVGGSALLLNDKLVLELEASGFESAIVGEYKDVALEQVARTERAFAAVRLNLKGKQVEVWVADRITGKVVARTIALNSGSEPEESIVVLAAVELLRASLMEIHAANKLHGEVSPTAQTARFSKPPLVVSPPKTKNVSVMLSVGAGAAYIGNETGMRPSAKSTMILELYNQFRFSVVGVFPMAAHEVNTPEGTAEIFNFFGGVEATATGLSAQHRVRPMVGFGLGAVIFWARGKENKSFDEQGVVLVAKEQKAVVPTPYVLLGGYGQLTSQLAVRAETMIGIAIEGTQVDVGGRIVAHLGRPWVAANLLLEVTMW